jgi:hypothetical protein
MPRVSVTLSRSGSHSDSGIPMYPQIGDWTQLIQLAILETYPQNDATLWLQQHSNMAESRAWRLQARVCCKRFTLRHIQLLTQRLEQRLVVRAASSRFSKVVGKVFKSVGGYVRRFNRSLNDLIFQYYFNIYISVFCAVPYTLDYLWHLPIIIWKCMPPEYVLLRATVQDHLLVRYK